MIFEATIALRGRNGKVSRQNFDLGDFTTGADGTDFEAALNAANQIAGAYATITGAVVADVSVRHSMPAYADGSVPSGDADVHEYATITCYLNAPGEAEKVTNIRVLAPVDGVFAGTEGELYDQVDTADADLVQYVQQLSQHAYVSDGEQINTGTGANGMKGGRRNARSFAR